MVKFIFLILHSFYSKKFEGKSSLHKHVITLSQKQYFVSNTFNKGSQRHNLVALTLPLALSIKAGQTADFLLRY